MLLPKIVVAAVPLILMAASTFTSSPTLSRRIDTINNKIVVSVFIVTLIVGSYVFSVFYPNYFLGIANQ